MRTTATIDKDIADRVMEHAGKLGNRSMAAMIEFMLRKACDFIEANGYDEFVKIPVGKNKNKQRRR